MHWYKPFQNCFQKLGLGREELRLNTVVVGGLATLTLMLGVADGVNAQGGELPPAIRPGMREDTDGTLEPNEYVKISPNGSITRALCPYTCEMRDIPKEYCRSWQSEMRKTECYVEDLRLGSKAIERNNSDDSNKVDKRSE